MKNDTQKTFSPTAVDFLAYIEGSMSESESRRFQDAVCADPVLHEELCNRRRDHWKRLKLPALSDLSIEVAELETELPWREQWQRIQDLCRHIGGELVAGFKSLGEAIQTIADTSWIPAPTATRLGRDLAGSHLRSLPDSVGDAPQSAKSGTSSKLPSPKRIHLQNGSCSLQIAATPTGFEFTVRLPKETVGKVELKQLVKGSTDCLERIPRCQAGHLKDGEVTVFTRLSAGIHPVIVEITRPNQPPIRWVCLVNRIV